MIRSTVVWDVYNWAIARYVREAVGDDHFDSLAYEDLAASPEATLDRIIAFLGESPSGRPEFFDNEVEVLPSHTASGNPNRFDSGRRAIRLDNEWERSMPRWRKAAVTLVALPMLGRLGYSWRAGRRARTAELTSR